MSALAYDPVKRVWYDPASGAAAGLGDAPQLPTYRTIAAVLEKKTGSGIRLLGWTAARTVLIAPVMMLVGVPAKQAWGGALLASGMISALALIRVKAAGDELSTAAMAGHTWPKLSGPTHCTRCR